MVHVPSISLSCPNQLPSMAYITVSTTGVMCEYPTPTPVTVVMVWGGHTVLHLPHTLCDSLRSINTCLQYTNPGIPAGVL